MILYNAEVYGNAVVEDNARVRDFAKVYGYAVVKDSSDIYKEYNPYGYSLSLAVTDKLIIVNNEYWKDDINNPLTKIIERKGANIWTDQVTKEDIEQDIKQE